MVESADRVFISIAVSNPGGNLAPLPGAVNAAKRMALWASTHGYLTVCIHDEDSGEITVNLLREKIASAIDKVQEQRALSRLVIFFAGHGAALASGDQYWILSNWNANTSEAVKVSALQRVLEFYRPSQVAIISDACQEYSARFMDLIGSAVLNKPNEDPQQFELDQFFAVDTGRQAFMVKATETQEAFCIFTEVFLDALQGDTANPSFDQIGEDRMVTSQSLSRHLKLNVALEAGKYGERMYPRLLPGFFSDCVYAKLSSPLPPSQPAKYSPSRKIVVRSARKAGEKRASLRSGKTGEADPGAFRTVQKVEFLRPTEALPDLEAKERESIQAREALQRAYFDEVVSHEVRDHFETETGICVSGAIVERVEVLLGDASRTAENPNWYRIRLDDQSSLASADALVTLSDGRICAVCVVQGFIAALHVISDGSLTNLLHQPSAVQAYENEQALNELARLQSGLLRPQEIVALAAQLREGKHRAITLGCVAAQFYDAIRDVSSLQQMAGFYAQKGQPLPLDIALYGGCRISERDGRLYAAIPAVKARAPRINEELHRPFTFAATPGSPQHPIAGRVPWMRQAWSAIETAVCDSTARSWQESASSVLEHLGSSNFTCVSAAGRPALLKLAFKS